MSSAASGAGQELGKQIINAPIKLAGYTGDKALSLAGYSAKTIVKVATDSKSQEAFSRSMMYLNSPGYRQFTRQSQAGTRNNQFVDYNQWRRQMGY